MKFKMSLIALCFVSATAYSQVTVPGLMSDLSAGLQESTLLQGTLSGFTLENERLMKENKVLADNREQQNRNLASLTAASQVEIDNKKASLQAGINAVEAEYNGLGCVGSLPPDKYNYCQQMYTTYSARIEEMKRNGNAIIKNMVRDLDASRLAPIRDIINRQTVRINQIAGTMKSNFDEFGKVQDKKIAAEARNAQIRAQLADLCANARNGSAAYQLCHGVNWDGRRTDLPPLTGPGKGTVIVPNKQ